MTHATDALLIQARSALNELRRVRNLFAGRGEPSEAEAVNSHVKAMKAAITAVDDGGANAAALDMLKALKRQVANVERWLATGEPASKEESKSIYDQMVAAIAKAAPLVPSEETT